MPKKIILIRHGETDHNKNRIIQGWLNIDLNGKGIKQASKLTDRLMGESIDVIYTSDLNRTVDTIKNAAHKKKIKLRRSKSIRERFFGDFEGKAWDQIKEQIPEAFKKSRDERNKIWSKHGVESVAKLQKRLKNFLKTLSKNHSNQNVAISLHGGSKRNILRILGLTKPEEMMRLSNTGVTVLEKNKKGKYEVKVFNDTSHLK